MDDLDGDNAGVDVIEAEVVEQPPEAEEAPDQAVEAPEAPAEPQKRPSGSAKLKQQRDEERARNAELARELEELRSKVPESKVDDGPDPDKFETMADYNRAVIQHEIAKANKPKEDQPSAQQQSYIEKAEAYKKENPEFEQDIAEYLKDNYVSKEMYDAIIDSEIGPQVAHYITHNAQLGDEMLAMTPRQLSKEIGKIEERILSQGKRETRASAPIKPVTPQGGSQTTVKDPGQMSAAEFRSWMKVKQSAPLGWT